MINVIMCGFALWSDAIDSHRSFSDKHGLAGKREMPIEEDFKTGKLSSLSVKPQNGFVLIKIIVLDY